MTSSFCFRSAKLVDATAGVPLKRRSALQMRASVNSPDAAISVRAGHDEDVMGAAGATNWATRAKLIFRAILRGISA